MKNLLLKYILKILGKDIFKEFEELKKLESNSLEDNLKIQEKKLKNILIYAWNYVPYYKKILTESKVVIDGQVNLNNFENIPILTKEIIRNNFKDLTSKDLNYEKRKPYINTSGGSTGEPVKFIQDKETWTKGMADKWLYYSFISDKFPCKLLKLWGSERDILKGGYGLQGNFKNWLYSRKFLNSFKMSPKDMGNYVKEINSYKPVIIEAYVQSIYELAKYIKDNKLNMYSPKGIITSAGTLYSEMKTLIEEVFNCKVYNRYGSREVGDIACSCEKDEGLHLNIFAHYFEILNNKNKSCKPDEYGKVYITTFDNYSMPLIRYDIGDMALSSKKQTCSCGRGIPLFEKINGRVNSILMTEKGAVDSTALTTSFYYLDSIKKYQLIQKTKKTFILRVELENKKKWEFDKKIVIVKMHQIFGDRIDIKFIIETKIDSLDNGKFQYIISELK